MSRVLLTGAAGFVGRNLLAEAVGSGHLWTALDLGFPEGAVPDSMETETVTSDLSDPDQIHAILERVRPEIVIHLAGWTGKGGSAGNRAALLSANLASTWNLLDAIASSGIAKDAPVRFLLASSALVYGNQSAPFDEAMETRPADEYAFTKHLAEETVRAFARRGLVVPVVLRPAVIYGPGQKGSMFVPSLVEALHRGCRFPMTQGAQRRDLVHVRDVARAILSLAGGDAAGVFNVGTGRGVPMVEIGRILASCAGRSDLLGVGDLPYRGNEVWDYAVASAKLSALTGWSAEVALEDGLRETFEKGRIS